MKTVSAPFVQHLAGEVTTLATWWETTHQDGAVLGFTDHIPDLRWTASRTRRPAATRIRRSAARHLAFDNLDVESVLAVDGIMEKDLRPA